MNSLFKRLPTLLAEYGITVRGIVHIGAHMGEEVPLYRTMTDNILLVEPNPDFHEQLALMPVKLSPYAVGDGPDHATLHCTVDHQRSSLLRPITEPMKSEIVVPVIPLRYYETGEYNVLVLDIQGAELAALKTGRLTGWDAIVCELDEKVRYVGAASPEHIMYHLGEHGYDLVTDVPHTPDTWISDALFVRTTFVHTSPARAAFAAVDDPATETFTD